MQEKLKLNHQTLINGLLLYLNLWIILPSVQFEIELEKKLTEIKGQKSQKQCKTFDLLIYCYELQSQNLQHQPQQRQLATFLHQQHRDEQISQTQTVQPIQQLKIQQKQRDFQNKMKDVVLIHENLALNIINQLLLHNKLNQSFLKFQSKQGQQLDESEIQELSNILKFKDFLETDTELSLRNSGIYQSF